MPGYPHEPNDDQSQPKEKSLPSSTETEPGIETPEIAGQSRLIMVGISTTMLDRSETSSAHTSFFGRGWSTFSLDV